MVYRNETVKPSVSLAGRNAVVGPQNGVHVDLMAVGLFGGVASSTPVDLANPVRVTSPVKMPVSTPVSVSLNGLRF